MVYPQLSVTDVGGTSHHLIKHHKGNNNGYAAWNALCEWYYGGAVKNETAHSLRYKLEIYCLTFASNAAQYFSNFLTSF